MAVFCFWFREARRLPQSGRHDRARSAEFWQRHDHARLGFRKGFRVGTADQATRRVDGLETQSAYLIVSDADAVYAKAKAAGAEILLDIKDEPHSAFAPVSPTTLAHFTSSLFT